MNKVSLNHRLKKYIESKLPSLNNINDIPKDISMFENIKSFKLFGETYSLSTTYSMRTDIVNLFNGKSVYISYRCNTYDLPKTYPEYIYFEICLVNGKMIVENILGSSRKYYGNPDIKPIEMWSFEKEE